MPTRFKYTKVQPQAYALSPVEILLATDAELNQYMGIKKYAPYRKDSSNWDKNRAGRLTELKEKLAQRRSKMGGNVDIPDVLSDKPVKKRKGKKERMKNKAATMPEGVAGTDLDAGAHDQEIEAKLKGANKEEGKSKKRKADEDLAATQPPDRAEDTSVPAKSKRRRHKKAKHDVED